MIDPGPRHVLVIGAQRCGTTYVTTLLDSHPQITMARPARPEPKVFCDADLAERGLDWYLRTYFSHARDEEVLGEKSTSYLEDPQAASRAARMLGEAHVVVVLREPVQRAVSNWRFSTRNGLEARSIEEALRADLEDAQTWDPTATSVSPFAYLRRGRYSDYLAPWASTFPDTMHVLFLEELLAGPAATEGLLRALGVDRSRTSPPFRGPVNASKGVPPALSGGLRGTLKGYYAQSNAALSIQLGRKLPW